MKQTLKNLLYVGIIGAFLPFSGYSDLSENTLLTAKSCETNLSPESTTKSCKAHTHRMQLYLADAFGVEVPGTDFWINITVLKEKVNGLTRVTLQLPSISFVTGPYANNIYETDNPIAGISLLPPPQNGGYLYTRDGFLPEDLRPSDVLPRTYFGPSDNGHNIPFTYNLNDEPPFVTISYTSPQPGYQIRVTNAGGLVIEGIGTFANIIPPGTQQLTATDISYLIKPYKKHICENKRISTGPINVAQYTFPPATPGNFDNVRDHHINDAFDNVVAYAWSDNSNIPNAAANPLEMHLAYSIGKVKDGELKMHPAKFLPTPADFFIFDTSIAINRTNPDNIVLGYGVADGNSPGNGQPKSLLYAAVSFDGGKTWPINGPTNVQPTGNVSPGGVPAGYGDATGVQADKFGNFWYMASNRNDSNGNLINLPFIMVSSDGGQNWTLVYTFPYDFMTNADLYDYPSFCFGGDGQGNYGVQIVADFFPNYITGALDGYPSRAFIPVTGLGSWGTVQQANLPQLTNNIIVASITASADGRVWTYGNPQGLGPGSYAFPGGFTNNRLVFKSPGPIDVNYAGPWGVVRYNTLQISLLYPVWQAAPIQGFFQSVQTNLFDEERQALYVILNAPNPDLSNNSDIYFLISRDNGLTFSRPFKINTSSVNNRGFPSMALDSTTGNLLLGWYDCRKYDDGVSFNYYGAVIDSCTLDKLTKEIPLSNPLFAIPAGGYDTIAL